MNKIFKVIYSKVRNCYVVTSEFAKANTKSSTGSEKSKTGKKALLTLAVASAIMCGGFVNVGAAETVHVDESTNTTYQEVYTKDGADKNFATKDALITKADATTVTTNTTNIETNKNSIQSLQNNKLDKTTAEEIYAKKTDVATNTVNIANNTTKIAKKIDKDLADASYAKSSEVYTKTEVNDALTAASTNVNTKLANYAKTADVNAELAKKADTDSVYSKTEANNTFTTKDGLNAAKTELEGKITNNTTNITSNKEAIDDLKTKVGDATGGLTKTVNDLTGKVNTVESDITDLKDNDVELEGKINTAKSELNAKIDNTKTELSNADTALDAKITANKDKIQQNTNNIAANKTAIDNLKTNVGTVTGGDYLDGSDTIAGNLGRLNTGLTDEVAARTAADTALSDRIGKLSEDGTYIKKSDTNNVSANLKALDDQAKKNATNTKTNADNIQTNTEAIAKEKAERTLVDGQLSDRIDAEETARALEDGKLSDRIDKTDKRTAGIERTDTVVEADNQTVIEGKVHFDQEGNISKVKDLGAETVTTSSDATIGGDLKVKKNTTLDGTLTAKGESTFKENVKVEKDLTVDGKLNVGEISMKNTVADSHGNNHDSSTTITADGISNTAKITDRDRKVTESKFTHDEKGSTTYAHEGDSTDWKEATSNVTAAGVENIAKDSKGNNNTFTQTSTETKNTLADKDNKNTNEFTQTATDTTNTLTDAAGNTSSTRQDAKGNYGYAKDKDGNKSYTKQQGDRIAESVIGKDSKETKSEMTTTDITNTAKFGTIKNDAKDIENIASGNIKNSSATMDTTVTGKATESYGELETKIKGTQSTTVEGNVTEDYKKNLTTTVGGDELHEVTGTKTETVTGKVTENFNGGQETNVTGDQTTIVSGTQTTTATDIKRNASSSMVDNISNDYGTNTETKVAGKTTTDMTITGTGEKGEYIRGANEAKDTLTKGTLKNSETKTVEATSTEITDGSGNTSSTIQDKSNLAGSVTNGTETGVSGIHGNADGSVSIDSSVSDKTGNVSTINQKKGSITSAVSDGTNSTVISQDKSNVTIASNNGTIAIAGKDIINNATGNMTNTVGGELKTTVTGKTTEEYKNGLDTTVTGDENHKVTGKQTNTIEGGQENIISGGQTNTITGDQTTTVTGDISNKAKNIVNTADESITNNAKVINNKASEVINNEAVNINNKASGIISSSASEIKNQADKLISNKVGENTYQNIEDGKITESIKNGTKQNLTQSDADKTEHSVVDGVNASVTRQTSTTIEEAVTDGTNTNASLKNASMSAETITNGTQANTVASTANGTTFTNSDASTALTEGGATNTTIKGNTITTGKVTMDYADVMKDLGVKGNANIAGKTTTGELEVTGKSTFKGDVTMESNATVKKDLTVEGTTTTKDLKVTNNASVGGTLDVTGKASFKDSVDVAKDLSVGGNATITGDVTANSYKVGNKTYIDSNGINANNQKITNVADGTIAEGSTDAVNGGQLFATNRRIEQFDSRINEVGANAAAIANLHPMEFDADSKLNVAVGVGNYRNKTATAMGVFYRPNEDVMFNVSSTIGSNDNMVGGGISFRLGSGGNKEKTKALAQAAEQNKQLKSQVDTLQAQMDALLSVINPNMSKDFPDVPNNHWAYEAVSRLAGNDIIQGYEDGKYHGERTMTRYEMAVIIYKALQKGAKAEAKLVEEFKPELKAIAAHEKA